MNNREEKLKNLLFGIINKLSKDADVYHHNGSLWLIHTESRKWIVEFTRERTLWFNYNFFRTAFKFVSLDVNNNQHYVTEWFVLKFLNKPKVEETWENSVDAWYQVEDTIQNGVNRTCDVIERKIGNVEDTIQNGVKHTLNTEMNDVQEIEDTIQNGAKRTFDLEFRNQLSVENTIQNGVKDIQHDHKPLHPLVDDAIENGVKETHRKMPLFGWQVEDAIQNGVKESREVFIDMESHVEDTIQNGVKETCVGTNNIPEFVEDAIENGVKETKRSYNGSRNQRTKYAIENGVKETNPTNFAAVDEAIQNGVKSTHRRIIDVTTNVEDTIENGVKNTLGTVYRIQSALEDTIENGVKDTKLGAPNNRDYFIEDTIENGVKLTNGSLQIDGSCVIEEVIQDGVKQTSHSEDEDLDDVEDTIQNGVKETRNNRLPRTVHVMNTIINGVKVSKPMDEWVNTERIVGEVVKDGVKELKVWKSNRREEHGYFEFVDGTPTYTPMTQVQDVIENGVKEIQPLPAQDGNMDWGNYYHGKEDRTKPFNEYLDDAIRFGVKETYDDCSDNIARVEGIIRVGKKLD